ncbi:MAG: hypothetical protein Fur0012_12180 [Elusimicrobiota bacterium]
MKNNKKKISNIKTSKKVKTKSPQKRKTIVHKSSSAPKAAQELFSKAELSEIEAKLLENKTDLVKNIEDKKNYDLKESEVGDQIDEASDSLDKEILFGSSENERKILEEIEAALRRIKNGSYGKCEQCGIIIDRKRIKALPYSRYCIKCQIKNDSYK